MVLYQQEFSEKKIKSSQKGSAVLKVEDRKKGKKIKACLTGCCYRVPNISPDSSFHIIFCVISNFKYKTTFNL